MKRICEWSHLFRHKLLYCPIIVHGSMTPTRGISRLFLRQSNNSSIQVVITVCRIRRNSFPLLLLRNRIPFDYYTQGEENPNGYMSSIYSRHVGSCQCCGSGFFIHKKAPVIQIFSLSKIHFVKIIFYL